MTTDNQLGIPPKSRNSRTPQQVREQQEVDAARSQQHQHLQIPQQVSASHAPQLSATDREAYRRRYLDDIAPVTFPGKLIKFTKNGQFTVADSAEVIEANRDFVALCDETLVGWIKFSQDGEPPARIQGLLYDGFVMPERETLGDNDEAHWPLGLSGRPEDPWLHQMCLVLQDRIGGELFTFATTSKTGRRAVGGLLRHYDRLQRTHPDEYPVVRLKTGAFDHQDERIGKVNVPVFTVVGRAPKASAAVPDTSLRADLDDDIPI